MAIKTLNIIILFLVMKGYFTLPTCDFDLDNIDEILQYLPADCQKMKKGDENYEASLKESKKFAEFLENLNEYEKKQSPTSETPEDWKLRIKLYNEGDLYVCGNKTSNHLNLYKCLQEKREKMIKLLAEQK